MSVTKNVMAPGSFTIELDRDVVPVPHSISDAAQIRDQAFGHILVFPARIDPRDFADATLFDLSVFTGVYRVQANRTTLRGQHASIWLGDPNGKGPVLETTAAGNFNLATWIAGLKPGSLYAGTYGAPAGTLDWSTVHKTPREDIDFVADYFGCEWQVTDDLTLNVDTVDNLYGATPTVIATPDWDGRDSDLTAIRATFDADESAEEYTTRVLLEDTVGGLGSANISPATPYDDGRGNAVQATRFVGSSSALAGTATTAAAGQLERNDQIDQHITASTDAFCPMADIACGAPIYAYDAERNIYDTTVQVTHAGAVVWPMALRVQSIEMRLRQGMGVVFRSGAGVYTDLSDYVAWESGPSRMELGARPIAYRLSQAVQRRGIRI